jgi:dienelactone hydrolase
MKKILVLIVAVSMLAFCSCSTQTGKTAASTASLKSSSQVSGGIEASAKTFVEFLYSGKYSNAEARFDSVMAKAMTTDALKSTWEQVEKPAGNYLNKMSTQKGNLQGYDYVVVTTQHENRNILTRVVFDSQGKVAGIQFNYGVQDTSIASTVTTMNFTEYHFDLIDGTYKLPAILTLPLNAKNCSAVILVQGSGPSDMDETIDANKPFRDLANGLAEKGIAVLRYDKRTLVYSTEMAADKTLTVKQEVIDDVAAAFNWISSRKEINTEQIYIVGHSLGACLAPRIALSCPKTAGLVLLAGSPRPLEDIIVDQAAELAPSQLDAARQNAQKIKALNPSGTTQTDEMISGAYAAYWKDLDSVNEIDIAKQVNKRMLILQGERDAQVFMKDFNLWKSGLSGLSDVSFKSYPKLNHLFIEGSGAANIKEYSTPGKVAQYVIDDIAAWIKKA